MQKIALNTDFVTGVGDPAPRLRLIAEAGFTHIHWCHQWNTDFLYTAPEIAAIAASFREYGLTLLDIHGTAGVEKCWFSTVEYQRKAGVELVRNRLEMMQELHGEGALMMHIPCRRVTARENWPLVDRQFEQLKKSIDELMPVLDRYDALIAVENMAGDTFETIAELMRSYPANRIGITYDSGHGNFACHPVLPLLAPWKDRIEALHLHDNNGLEDQHQPPYYGNLDWEAVTDLLASAKYDRPLSFELAMRNTPFYNAELKADQTPKNFLRFMTDAYERCLRVVNLYEFKRKKRA